MEIKLATHEDLPKLFPLFDEFNNDVVDAYGMDFDPDIARKSLDQILLAGKIFMLNEGGEAVGGMAGLITSTFTSAEKIFSAMFFYVKPSYRSLTKKFIIGVENMLKCDEVKRMVLGHMAGNRTEELGRFYKMIGYRKLEIHYIKEVCCA